MKNHEEALADFLGGMSLKDISLKYNVAFRTVNTWHTRHGWADKRQELLKRYEETIYNTLCRDILRAIGLLLKHVLVNAENVNKADLEMQETHPLALERVRLALGSTIRAGYLLAGTLSKIIPMCGDEKIAEKIYEELKRLGVKE